MCRPRNQFQLIATLITLGCPLWVMSRHRVTSASCPLFPLNRTFISAICTSAECQRQTFSFAAGPIAKKIIKASMSDILGMTSLPRTLRPGRSSPFESAYMAAKHGMLGLTQVTPLKAPSPATRSVGAMSMRRWSRHRSKPGESPGHPREQVISEVLVASS